MTLPSGYRFFRDDALLEIHAKETRYCDRCDELYWITNEDVRPYSGKGESYIGNGYCPKCTMLIQSRLNTLNVGDRPIAGCPISSLDYIYTKEYHNHSGRGKKKKKGDR